MLFWMFLVGWLMFILPWAVDMDVWDALYRIQRVPHRYRRADLRDLLLVGRRLNSIPSAADEGRAYRLLGALTPDSAKS